MPDEHGNPTLEELQAEAAEAQTLRRKLAFSEAGIDINSVGGQLLLNVPGLDVSDQAKLIEQAKAVNALKAPAAPAAPAAPPAGQAVPGNVPPPTTPPVAQAPAEPAPTGQVDDRLGLGGEGTVPPGEEPKPHPGEAGLAAFHKAMADGNTRINASSEYFSRVIDGAVNGDKRVIHDPRAWAELAAEERQNATT